MMALMIFRFCQEILNYTEFSNGETPKVSSVTVWETATGRCTVDEEDIKKTLKMDNISRTSRMCL